jgi:hypothetical protein
VNIVPINKGIIMVFWFHIICSVVIFVIFLYSITMSILFFALFLYSTNIIDLVPYSSKCSLGDVNVFHMYLVVSRMQIKLSEILITTQLIQEIISDRNGKLVLDGEFIEGMKVRTHAPSTLFIKYHDHMRRIRVGTRADSTYL